MISISAPLKPNTLADWHLVTSKRIYNHEGFRKTMQFSSYKR